MARLTIYSMLSASRVCRDVQASRLSEVLGALPFDPSYDLVVSLNGSVVDASLDVDVLDSDFIGVQVVPASGSARTVALTIVTVVATLYLGPAAAEAIGVTSKVGVALVTAAVTAGMSSMANAVLPPPTADLQSGAWSDRSNTYGWEVVSNDVAEGAAVPVLMGALTFAPLLVSNYIETVDDNQYFHGLYLVSGRAVDSISSVTVNGTDISLFSGTTYETRLGAVNQSVIAGFELTRTDKSWSAQLESGADWSELTTDGDAVTGIVVAVYWNCLYKVDKDGDDAGEIETAQWSVTAEYSADGVTWASLGQVVASGKSQSPVRRTISISGLSAAQYTVRVKASYDTDNEGSEHPSECYVEYLQEVAGTASSFPGYALLGIRALATGQLSGSRPLVKCRAMAGSSNPSVQAQQMLALRGALPQEIDSAAFAEWEADCDDRGFSCNIMWDAAGSLKDALTTVGELGRASIERFGSVITPVMDRANPTPSQGFLFSIGDIARDSFEIEYVDPGDRANVIEYTYYPDDTDNEPVTRQVVSGTYATDLSERRTQIKLIGCTDGAMAKRQAQYRLRCNRYLTVAPSWSADVASLVCRPGDVVRVAHDAPRWGESGKLVYGDLTGVQLDRQVTLTPGVDYAVQVRRSVDNSLLEALVVTPASVTTTAMLTFRIPMSVAPAKYDSYSFGEVDQVSRLVTLKSIETTSKKGRKLVGIEYVPGVHVEDSVEVSDVPEPSLGVRRLRVAQYVEYAADGTPQLMLWVGWTGSALTYTVSYTQPAALTATSFRTSSNEVHIPVSELGIYSVRVSDQVGHFADKSFTVTGYVIPPVVTGFLAFCDLDGIVRMVWDISPEPSATSFEIRLGESWEDSERLMIVRGTSAVWPVSQEYSDQDVTLWLKAIGGTGLRSAVAAYAVVSTGASLFSLITANTELIQTVSESVDAVEGTVSAHADTLTQLAADIESVGGVVDGHATAIQSLSTDVVALGDDVTAVSSSVTTLGSTVAGHSTTIEEQSLAMNGISGRWAVTIDANGVLTGLELIGGGGNRGLNVNGNMLVNGTITTNGLVLNAVTETYSASGVSSATTAIFTVTAETKVSILAFGRWNKNWGNTNVTRYIYIKKNGITIYQGSIASYFMLTGGYQYYFNGGNITSLYLDTVTGSNNYNVTLDSSDAAECSILVVLTKR